MKRIVITGATGLLGRNLLFEITKEHLERQESTEILLLGRPKDSLDFCGRALEILCGDGARYCGLDHRTTLINFFEQNVHCLDMDLNSERLGMCASDLEKLGAKPIDYFFHIAALTDFRDGPAVIESLWQTNVEGTKQVLSLVSSLSVGEFVYVGSAYSCGLRGGRIPPNCMGPPSSRFRNPYEKSKLEAEMEVRSFAQESGVRCRYFRPSTICGRLMEPPTGCIHKFDVFYAWAAFFLRAKMKAGLRFQERYTTPVELPVRVFCSEYSGLNIVPADYAAKVMCEICFNGHDGLHYHLVNSAETPHRLYIPLMLQAINVIGPECVSEMPTDLTPFERLYYKTVGKIYTPYVASVPMLFDVSDCESYLRSHGLTCPPVDEDSFKKLMLYAKGADFGLGFESEGPAQRKASLQ